MFAVKRAAQRAYRRMYATPLQRAEALAMKWRITLLGSTFYDRYRRVRDVAARLPRGLARRLRPTAAPTHRTTTRPAAAMLPGSAQGGATPAHGLPIVLMHRGNSDYLRYTIGQARRSNPTSPIYLLGDQQNDQYPEAIHLPYRTFYTRAAQLERAFRHFSTNGLEYTRFDFQRWLILDEFLHAQGHAACIYIDSDVLLFTDVTRDRERFADFDFAIAHITGSVFYLNRLAALRDLGDFILGIYTGKDRYHYDRMVAHYVTRHRNGLPGGACDMMALDYYHEAHYGRIGDVAAVRDGSVYDLAIGAEQGFVMQDGLKDLEWREGVPYGRLATSGHSVRFHSLHCQGKRGKAQIAPFYERAGAAYGLDSGARALGESGPQVKAR